MSDSKINKLRSAIDLQIDILKDIRDNQLTKIQKVAEIVLNADCVVTTGIGKSGFIAQKFSSSLISLGQNSRYLHPTEALHGDIGVPRAKSVLIVFSKSGNTAEVLGLLKLQVVRKNFTILAVTADNTSRLAQCADHTILLPSSREYDDDNLLPTASTTTSLAISDLIVAAVANLIEQSADILRATHPNGEIGRILLTRISDVMSVRPRIPVVHLASDSRHCIKVLNEFALGLVCGVDDNNKLCGILTDGDVRRLVSTSVDLEGLTFIEIASRNPITVKPDDSLHDALLLMENGDRKVMVLPVVTDDGEVIGIVRMHDIVNHQIAG